MAVVSSIVFEMKLQFMILYTIRCPVSIDINNREVVAGNPRTLNYEKKNNQWLLVRGLSHLCREETPECVLRVMPRVRRKSVTHIMRSIPGLETKLFYCKAHVRFS